MITTGLRTTLGLTTKEFSLIRRAAERHRNPNPLDFVLQFLLAQCGKSRMDEAETILANRGYLFLRRGLLLPKDSAEERAHTLALFVLMHLTFPERYPVRIEGSAATVFDCAAFGTGEKLHYPPQQLLVSRGRIRWRQLEAAIRRFSQTPNKTAQQTGALEEAQRLLEKHRLFGSAEGNDSSEAPANLYRTFRELSDGLEALTLAFAESVGRAS